MTCTCRWNAWDPECEKHGVENGWKFPDFKPTDKITVEWNPPLSKRWDAE